MGLKELWRRVSESERQKKFVSVIRSRAKPALITIAAVIRSRAKPALITIAAVVGVVGVMIFSVLAISHEEDVSDFLKRWEQIMESGNTQAYAAICSKDFKEKSKPLYEETKNLITEQGINISTENKDIEKTRLDDSHYVIKHIPIFLSKAGVNTYEKLDIKRKGLINRKWEVDLEERHFSKAAEEELKQIASIGKPLTEPGKTPLDTDFRMRQVLEVWRTAWENGELDSYIDCYADYAVITRVTVVGGKENRIKLTKSKLRDHTARLNKRYAKVQVQIFDLKIEGDMATAKANFLQEYTSWGYSAAQSPVYHDFGTKELQFVKHDTEWKITDESWTIYKEVPTYPRARS
jgi:ketosteroid isomerase-like protein